MDKVIQSQQSRVSFTSSAGKLLLGGPRNARIYYSPHHGSHSAARAHHPTLVNYDPAKFGTVTGKVAKVQWTNPHVVVAFDVIGSDGSSERWFIEGYPAQDAPAKRMERRFSARGHTDHGFRVACTKPNAEDLLRKRSDL